MKRRFQRLSTLVLVLILLSVGMLGSTGFSASATAADVQSQQQAQLERLALALGRDPAQLLWGGADKVSLLDGTAIVRIKAIDRSTDEIIGASFRNNSMVDEAALTATLAASWRAAHGAISPGLLDQLQPLRAGDLVKVGLWLKNEVQPLPRPSFSPPSEQGSAVASADQAAPAVIDREKAGAQPLSLADVPLAVQQQLRQAQAGQPAPTGAVEKPAGAEPDWPAVNISEQQALAEFKARNDAALRAQVAPLQAALLPKLAAAGLTVDYASDIAPLIYVSGTRAQIEALAGWPEIDGMDSANERGGPALSIARPAQNANLTQSVGYDGTGVHIGVVEYGSPAVDSRISTTNPYLNVAQSCTPAGGVTGHATGVAGILASTHGTERGMAPGALLYSANCASIPSSADWSRTQAPVSNNSYWYDDAGTSAAMVSLDRQLDYHVRYGYDTVVVAAGNFGGNNCASASATPYVASPGKGYNVITVGNYDDLNSIGWSGDAMNVCSGYGNPNRDKPELAAIGTDITGTTTSSPWIGGIGSGTSYSSPMVAGLAATMIEANPSLADKPEAIKSLLMATALHNIEGDARFSDKDGAGGIDATATLASIERGHWSSDFVTGSANFPKIYTQFVSKGERVRFVINWLSNASADYTTDPLPADLDLRAYRADGTTFLVGSFSTINGFEIVEFIAPASESYQFKVNAFSYAGGSTWLGAGWWRGTYRILPDVGYADPKASPLGTHLSVYPSDWSVNNYWRAFGIRSPAGSDHDLALNKAAWFDDPAARSLLASSGSTGPLDYVLVDGNHWPAAAAEQYRVNWFSGDQGYQLSWSDQSNALLLPGIYGPYTISAYEVVKIFDVFFYQNQGQRIRVLPQTATNDFEVRLYSSDGSTSATWTKGRTSSVRLADAFGTGSGVEQLGYFNSGSGDWLGLVVATKQTAATSFYIQVEYLRLYVPLISR